jgi:HK97 family phage portal protein
MFDFLKRRPKAEDLTDVRDVAKWVDAVWGNTDLPADVTAKTAMGIPALWRAVNIISNDVARLTIRTFRRTEDGRERATDHPSYPLVLRKPWLNCNAHQFRRLLTLHAQITGNGFARIWRDAGGRPLYLEPLPPSPHTTIVIEGSGLNERLWVVYRRGNETYRERYEDVLHIPGLHFDGYSGLSVVEILQQTLSGAIAAQQYSTLYYSQGGTVAGYLKTPGKLREDQAKELAERWSVLASGMGRSHKVGVLDGAAEYVPIKASAEEAQLVEVRNATIIDVANITGVRPHDLGDQSRASYNSLEQENYAHADRCIEPWLKTWESELWDKLLTEEEKERDSVYMEFDRRSLIRRSLQEQANVDRHYREMGRYSINELRRRDNEEPILGGDKHYVPVNWINVNASNPIGED